MTLYLDRWRRWFRWFKLAVIPIYLEVSLTVASLRLAELLLADQSYFDKHQPYFDMIMAGPLGSEWKLGCLAMFAAIAKGVGIAILLLRRWPAAMDAAFVLRQLGWGLSVLLWGGLAISITVGGDTKSIGSILCVAACMLSIGGMLMGPVMPDEIDHEPS